VQLHFSSILQPQLCTTTLPQMLQSQPHSLNYYTTSEISQSHLAFTTTYPSVPWPHLKVTKYIDE
jgi:hypothetical protein